MWHRFVFGELFVPPVNVLLVQAALELLPDAKEPLWVGWLEAQALFHQLRIEVPHQARERLDAEAVGAEPVEALPLRAGSQLGARGTATRVPNLLDAVRLGHVEREIVILALELDFGAAAIDRRVVFFEQTTAG